MIYKLVYISSTEVEITLNIIIYLKYLHIQIDLNLFSKK